MRISEESRWAIDRVNWQALLECVLQMIAFSSFGQSINAD